MDLSNLSSTLPPTTSLESVSLRTLNHELTDEFKNAAKSVAALYNASTQKSEKKDGAKTEFAAAAKAVASLYRLGTNANILSMHKGYLECLDDLLSVIANGEDIENWTLTKRAEITNLYSHKDAVNSEPKTDIKEQSPTPQTALAADSEPVLPSEYDFAFPPELAAATPFHASFAPLSVSYKRAKNHVDIKHRKPPSAVLATDTNSPSSEAESDTSDSSSDGDVRKKRKLRQHESSRKRKRDAKRDAQCDN